MYYYYPVKSSCGFEKIGGVLCQPQHNVGVFSSSRQKKHNEATHTFSPLIYFVFNCTLETLRKFWRNSLVLAVNYVDFI